VWEHLCKHLTIKDLGEASWTLQMSIKRDEVAGTLKLSQETFTLEVLRRFNMSKCKPLPTPAVDSGDESSMRDPTTPAEQQEISSPLRCTPPLLRMTPPV